VLIHPAPVFEQAVAQQQGRIQPLEGPPVPLGERIGQLAGHELQRVVNGRLPAGSANSRDFRVFAEQFGYSKIE